MPKLSQEQVDALKAAFNNFDLDGNGFISPDELKKMMVEITGDQAFPENIVAEMVEMADKDGDGRINFAGKNINISKTLNEILNPYFSYRIYKPDDKMLSTACQTTIGRL